jgi:hypothetical protein
LKFLLKSKLNEIMSSSIGLASVLFAVQPVISMKVVILPTRTHRGGFHKRWDRQSEKNLEVQRHLMLRHAVFLDGHGQERFEEGIWLMPNGNLVMKIQRLVRNSVLNRRDMSQACVNGGISLTESNKFLT